MTGRIGRRAPEARRDAVIEAARALFVENGQDATTVDAIAKRAGVAKGTVYLYFPSKSHIAEAIEEQFNARILTSLRTAAREASAEGQQPVVAWCRALVQAYLEELTTHDMLFNGRTQTRSDADPLLEDLSALLTAQGHARPERTAAFLLGGTTLLIDRAIATSERVDAVQLAEAVAPLVNAVSTMPSQSSKVSR